MTNRATTLCHCWRLTLADGRRMGFTDHDRRIELDGLAFEPQSGFAQSEARATLGLAVDTADIEGALSSAHLRDEDIDGGLYDGATVETLLVDWSMPAVAAALRSAVVATITRSDGRFLAELESATRHLDRPNGRYLKRSCDAELGDARCRVALEGAAFTGTGTVTMMQAAASFVVDGLGGFEEGWFRDGRLEWTGGPHAGRVHRVVNHAFDLSGVVLTLDEPPDGLEIGWAFRVRAGCDKSFQTCREKFGNGLNFQGFPHLPGNDAAYAYVTDGVAFDGAPLVP